MPIPKKENRTKDRAKRRLMCRYGVDKADKTGFTMNLSPTGVFIKTNSVFAPGTTLHIELRFPERNFEMWGRVVWAKKVPPQLAHIMDCGMGVCFVDPTPEWLEFFEAWKPAG